MIEKYGEYKYKEESTDDSVDREVRPEQTLEDGSRYKGSWDKKTNK